MKIDKLLLLLCFLPLSLYAQTPQNIYEEACRSMDSMLSGKAPLDFKKAILLTENAYWEKTLDMEDFDRYLQLYAAICRGIISSGNIIYKESDAEKAVAQCAVFLFMTDSTPVTVENNVVSVPPFEYNFDDFAGQKEWSSTFVSTLLQTGKGNCHSLPYLYKLLMNELGHDAFLSLAPSHLYIKAYNKQVGWYNIELTCGDFPTDAWIMSSGYIHIDALRNGLYMDTLSLKQSIVLCLTDLARGYYAKFGLEDGRLILKCCENALEYFPHYINALLLKAEILLKLEQQVAGNAKNDSQTVLLRDLYSYIHRLGYRQMPVEMYLRRIRTKGMQTTDYRVKSLLIPTE
ncbi:MAG: hypothetical protein LBL18_02905 [Bacteroidales bacterium]|jgi:hypothetical protein|nr:hypothetical protein [Bacteroidales bacterium]